MVVTQMKCVTDIQLIHYSVIIQVRFKDFPGFHQRSQTASVHVVHILETGRVSSHPLYDHWPTVGMGLDSSQANLSLANCWARTEGISTNLNSKEVPVDLSTLCRM